MHDGGDYVQPRVPATRMTACGCRPELPPRPASREPLRRTEPAAAATTPNDLASLIRLKNRLLRFAKRYEQAAQPFQRKFTQRNIEDLIAKQEDRHARLAVAQNTSPNFRTDVLSLESSRP